MIMEKKGFEDNGKLLAGEYFSVWIYSSRVNLHPWLDGIRNGTFKAVIIK
jgi:hypothetical protein